MKSNKSLSDEFIFLRALSVSDSSQNYLDWLADPVVNRFLEIRFRPPRNLSELQAFVLECETDPCVLLMGIFLKKDGRHIGNIKIGPINRYHNTADVGFLIGDKLEWGKNYASRAILLISDYGFSDLGVEKFTATASAVNIASQKALIKAGFSQEGILRSQSVIEGKRQDNFIYGKSKVN